MEQYTVYVHVFPNGKRYFGITSHKDVNRRFQKGFGYRSQSLIWNAIQKYGWDNIEHIILHSGISKEEACSLEIQYISEYNTTDSRFGYNISKGGESCERYTDEMKKRISESLKGENHPMFGKHISEEHKRKISAKLKGKHLSEETKKKLSAARKGKPGRVQTQEIRNKISASLKGRKLSQCAIDSLIERNRNNPQGFCKPKKVICIDTGIVYDSLTHAGDAIGVSKNCIWRVCTGKRKTVRKLRFAYCE